MTDELPAVAGAIVDVQPLSMQAGSAASGLLRILDQLNGQFFGLDVRPGGPPPLIVRIRAHTGGDEPEATEPPSWRSELTVEPNAKLLWMLSLSDEASGGWPEVAAGSPVANAAVGSLNAWPAVRAWRLAPMESGERCFVFGRVLGPSFR